MIKVGGLQGFGVQGFAGLRVWSLRVWSLVLQGLEFGVKVSGSGSDVFPY